MKAYELLADESKWTKGSMARNRRGDAVVSTSHDAVCWCVIGAINYCYPEGIGPGTRDEAYDKVARTAGVRLISTWNDYRIRTHAEVLEVLRKADV